MAHSQPISISRVVIDESTQQEVMAVLRSGRLAWGPQVAEFETKIANICGTKYAIMVSSGTAALHTALSIIGCGSGDEVITSPFTYVATANAIKITGAKPIFVDIDPDTFNLNPDLLEAAISPRTKAILTVDLYGQPAPYRQIQAIARRHQLKLITDSAQAIGAGLSGRQSGSFGDLGCFSLYATKNLMSGEGGFLTTNSPRLNLRARRFRNHGEAQGVAYRYHGEGLNYCPTEIAATIALGQLAYLNARTDRRREIAARYTAAFAGIPGLITPVTPPKTEPVFHQYTLRITRAFPLSRDGFVVQLGAAGIMARIYYPQALHHLPHLRIPGQKLRLPEADRAARQVVSIPVNPHLTNQEVDYIIETIKQLASGSSS